MKTFKLLDYTAQAFYNKDQHYPFCLHLYDNCSGKQLHVGYYISVDQLCFNIHREMLLHDYHAYNPMQTLYAVERMRDGLDLWMDKLGG